MFKSSIFCFIWNVFISTSNICSTKPIFHHILWVYRVLLQLFLACFVLVVINKRFKIENKRMFFFVFVVLFVFILLFLNLLLLFFNGHWYTQTDVLCFCLKKTTCQEDMDSNTKFTWAYFVDSLEKEKILYWITNHIQKCTHPIPP